MKHEQLSLPFKTREINVGDVVRLTPIGRKNLREYFIEYNNTYLNDSELSMEFCIIRIDLHDEEFTHEIFINELETFVSINEIEHI